MNFELLETPGKPDAFPLTSAQAIDLFNQAVKAATALGLRWDATPIQLTPSPELVELVKKSQALAAAGEDSEKDGD